MFRFLRRLFAGPPPKEVDLTPDAYRRFLRAGGKPPLEWFLAQGPMDQEAMALLGDEYVDSFAGLATPDLGAAAESPIDRSHGEAVAAASSGGDPILRALKGQKAARAPVFLGRDPDSERPTPPENVVMQGHP